MRKLIAWFAKRFPEQMIVSLAEYEAMKIALSMLDRTIGDLNSRLVQVEAQLKRLNDMNGYVSSTKGAFKLER